MNSPEVGRSACVFEAGPFEESAQVFEGNPSVKLEKCPLDYVLELDRIDRP
jgi:hypothetical protein